LDGVARDAYRGHMEQLVARVLWKSESKFSVLLKIPWFQSKKREDFLQKLKAKTPVVFVKSKTGLKETISTVGHEEELDNIIFMGNCVTISSFSQPCRNALSVVISSSSQDNTQWMFYIPAAY
jgi:hypothetical protein